MSNIVEEAVSISSSLKLPPSSLEANDVNVRNFLSFFILILFANAVYTDVMLSVQRYGIVWGITSGFDISMIKWIAMWFVFDKFQSGSIRLNTWLDHVILAIAAFLMILPVSGLSWGSASLISVYFLYRRAGDENVRRGLWVLFALSISGFWARLFARFFMEYILSVDTFLVASATGAEYTNNLIAAADGSTTLVVTEGCSSFANLSLAFLGWILARSIFGTTGFWRSVGFVSLSAALVVFINTVRIGGIALFPDYYYLLHGPVGANIANITTTITVGIVAYYGARRKEASF